MPMSSKEMSRKKRRSHSRNTILEADQKRAKPLPSPSSGIVGNQEASVACAMDTMVVHINQARLTWMTIASIQYSERRSGEEGSICSMMVKLAMKMRSRRMSSWVVVSHQVCVLNRLPDIDCY